MVESFWVIPDVAQMRTPASILREQASALTEQTHGTLVGVVETKSLGDKLEISLGISVPSLNDYRYRILVYEQPLELYPGTLLIDDLYQVDNEEKFVALVKQTLASDRIRKALSSLLSQAADA